MKKNLLFLSVLLVFNFIIFSDLCAGPRASGRGGNVGGRGRSIQRSPSMSRSLRPSAASRPEARKPKISTPSKVTSKPSLSNPRIGGQSDAKKQIQQFVNNNPSTKLNANKVSQFPNKNSGSINNRGNGLRQIKNRNISSNIGNNVRNNVNVNYPNRGYWFNRDFFDNHYYHPPYYNTKANWWRVATAIGVGSWLGWQNQPYYYDYEDGYFGPVDYYSEDVEQIANSGDSVDSITNSDWLPLGVFALSKNGENLVTPNMFVQLALNKNGTISGTFYNAKTNEAYELEGEVDSDSQRAFWKMVDNEGSPVIEAGLYNLTQEEVPVQIHFSNGVVQQRLLVRVVSR